MVVEDCLRVGLEMKPQVKVTLPTHGRGGLKTGIDLEEKDEIDRVLEERWFSRMSTS